MGLDVYLKACSNKEEAKKLEAEYERRSEEIWNQYPEYDAMTQAEKDEARKACDVVKEELGLVGWGEHPDIEKIEFDSALHPDHYFKVGYFRSSYNSGGINSVFKRRNLPDLYDVFLPNNRYEFTPNWESCLDRARALLEQVRTYNEKPLARYDCMSVSANVFSGDSELPKEEGEVMAIFERHLQEPGAIKDGYGAKDGDFFLGGIKCVAFIPGLNIWKEPCVYVVYEKVDTEEQDWYEQAMEIVVETIEYVLAQPDKDDYYLVWSG